MILVERCAERSLVETPATLHCSSTLPESDDLTPLSQTILKCATRRDITNAALAFPCESETSMAIEYATIETNAGNGLTVKNTLSYHNNPTSNHLLVLLPGRNYYVSHPVLHYLRKVALIEGWDVLPVQYGFQVFHGTQPGDLLSESRQALNRALERGYGHVCIVGKSLGSPLAAQLAQECTMKHKSLLLLTPIGSAARDAGDIPTLAIIGTADPTYDAKAIEQDDRLTIRWRVYERLNHGLEIDGDWRASVDELNAIMTECEAFLRRIKGA